jgi:hypothetical protein
MSDFGSKYADDSTDSESTDDSKQTTSDVHLFMTDRVDPDHRDTTANINPEAYEGLSADGQDNILYNQFTEKQGRSNVWSRSDTVSHILANYVQVAEARAFPPAGHAQFTDELFEAVAAALEGDKVALMDFSDPDASDVVDLIAQSDDVDFEAITEEIKSRQSDD